MKRLAFYTFWEKDGIVRKYVLTYLKGLQEVADKIIVIVNGKLSLEGKEKLEKLGITILQRANMVPCIISLEFLREWKITLVIFGD